MPVTEETYRCLASEDPERKWELHDGELREKPDMSAEHNDAMFYLGHLLQQQLDRTQFRLRVNAGRIRRPRKTWYIPDVAVIPTEIELAQRGRPGSLEVYNEPLPLVVEIWSPSTGDYDVNTKFPDYRQRGDLEIWRLQLFERTLTVWRRQPDGSYDEEIFRGGIVRPVALPNVAIDLDLFFG
jgi:Uma2 family endonuclease